MRTITDGTRSTGSPRAVVTHGVADRELYVVHERDAIVATLALQWRDMMFWGERDGDAGYVHRLVVRRDRAGTGLGATILDWAAEQVREAARDWLRLDVPTDNVALCEYYERLGFEYRGDAEGELTQPDGVVRRWRRVSTSAGADRGEQHRAERDRDVGIARRRLESQPRGGMAVVGATDRPEWARPSSTVTVSSSRENGTAAIDALWSDLLDLT